MGMFNTDTMGGLTKALMAALGPQLMQAQGPQGPQGFLGDLRGPIGGSGPGLLRMPMGTPEGKPLIPPGLLGGMRGPIGGGGFAPGAVVGTGGANPGNMMSLMARYLGR